MYEVLVPYKLIDVATREKQSYKGTLGYASFNPKRKIQHGRQKEVERNEKAVLSNFGICPSTSCPCLPILLVDM
jgi:hypothetical protein